MTVLELKTRLDTEGIPTTAYSFESDGIGEVYRIASIRDMLGNGWEVYYAERGPKTDLLIHRLESDACDDLLRRLLREFQRKSSN